MDCVCQSVGRIDGIEAWEYCQQHLREVWYDDLRLETEYACPMTGKRWLVDHPRPELQGYGPPRLRVLPIPDREPYSEQVTCATVKVRWLPGSGSLYGEFASGSIEAMDAHLAEESGAWVDLVMLKTQMGGDTLVAPRAVGEKAGLADRLSPGTRFRVIVDADRAVVRGEVIELTSLARAELAEVFHFIRPVYKEPEEPARRTYAMVETTWLPANEKGLRSPAAGRLFARARLTADNTAAYSVHLFLAKPVGAEDVAVAPMAPVLEYVADTVLIPQTTCEVYRRLNAVARARVLEVQSVDQAEFQRVLHFDEPEVDWQGAQT